MISYEIMKKKIRFIDTLSPGQTDSQVVASSHKLNLCRDLRWVAKRTRKFPRKYTKSQKSGISCISLADIR